MMSEPTNIIYFDVDNFKAFNDVHGHDAGDAVLTQLADVVLDALKGWGTFARIGGEEFAVLVPETSAREAAAIADALRKQVAEFAFKHNAKTLPRVTISCGVASTDDKRTNPHDLLKDADTALYRAKDLGRDRVCVYGEDEMSDG